MFQGETPSGPVSLYDAATDAFAERELGASFRTGGIDGTGSHVVVDRYAFDGSLVLRATLPYTRCRLRHPWRWMRRARRATG